MRPFRPGGESRAALAPLAGRLALAGLVVLAASGVSACASAKVATARRDAVERTLAAARERGARRCAPRELAVAEARTAFATSDLARGHLAAATAHLTVAEPNAEAALLLAERCASPLGEVAPPPPAP